MARRRVFTVLTPLGYRVGLLRDRWREIVRYKHPALKGHERAVRSCLESPLLVRQSAKNPDVHLYYASTNSAHLCVIVAPSDLDDYFVVTAYFTKDIKKGNELWKS